MIKRVKLTRFKKYKSQSFELKPNGVSLLVGGNNAGKSTLIQALEVWEFCKMILNHEKGRNIFNKSELGKGEGFGMSSEEFLPIAVPTLNHLWTNLKIQLSASEKESQADNFPGYIMRIECTWDYKEQVDKILEIGLSLVNDRLFIRVTNSNLEGNDYLPTIVYLPTFAGVLPKENKATVAERRAFLGRGMAGSIIRNMIYDLYTEELHIKEKLLNGKTHLSKTDIQIVEGQSPLFKLQNNLRNTFQSQLDIVPFNEEFNTILKIYERKVVRTEKNTFSVLSKTQYTPRDIITQGSGYLQWLSIFCILYSSNIDILLLDEPDAHLHASLQNELLNRLIDVTNEEQTKQIFVCTHSVEMIQQAPLDIIFSMEERRYLSEESTRVAVLHGIGSEYFPKLDLLKKFKKLIFIENESDKKILTILGEKCNMRLPEDVVYWATTDSHQQRRYLFRELKKIIPELKCVSLRDRDMENIDVVGEGLTYKSIPLKKDESILLLEWRRKNIESYLLCPRAIAEASGHNIRDVQEHFSKNLALAIDEKGFVEATPPETIILTDGKGIFTQNDTGLEYIFNINKYDVAKHMNSNEVCDDIKTFITRTCDFFSANE